MSLAIKNKFYLYIENLEPKKVQIVIFNEQKIISQKRAAVFSDKILALLDTMLGGRKKLSLCSGIVINQGPGTFSAVRSAVLLANSLSELLALPVVAVQDKFEVKLLPELIQGLLKQKQSQAIKPIYNREPNITMARK